jgi:hypothetical protein
MIEAPTLQSVLNKYSPQLKKLSPFIPPDEKQELVELIEEARCAEDALYWGQNWTLTENPKFKEQGREWRAPFPKKSYFTVLFQSFKQSKHLFIPKTREMLTSWCVMLYACHAAQWGKAEIIVQTDKEDKASELVGYAECLWRNQAEFLKLRHPLKQPASNLSMEWRDGGRIFGIPKGVNQVRLYHPTIYIMDEAAFLPEAEQCYNAAQPVAGQIIAISSAGPGWFGDQCSL